MDNLCKQKKIIVNALSMCLADEKMVDHLFLKCRVALTVWSSVHG